MRPIASIAQATIDWPGTRQMSFEIALWIDRRDMQSYSEAIGE